MLCRRVTGSLLLAALASFYSTAFAFDAIGAGVKVKRADMKAGDLVFFHIRGKRISHVGIYLGDGRFIHAPTTGKRVSISSLDSAYWSRHFAGAKRPKVLS